MNDPSSMISFLRLRQFDTRSFIIWFAFTSEKPNEFFRMSTCSSCGQFVMVSAIVYPPQFPPKTSNRKQGFPLSTIIVLFPLLYVLGAWINASKSPSCVMGSSMGRLLAIWVLARKRLGSSPHSTTHSMGRRRPFRFFVFTFWKSVFRIKSTG